MNFDFFGDGKHKITPAELLNNDNGLFLDVRSKEEFDTFSFSLKHHIQSKHIPIDEIPERVSEIPKDKLVGIFCPASIRASMVFMYLYIAGYSKIKIVEGGCSALTDELKPGKVYKKIH
ncbi:MAG: rhodanese-like domain-containing protein [Melioribacteraceae bacterium]|nr:rhodanese-like domain-containing protein [Melioribacteraceae bacterium]